ncbi:unnamed protein product [Arabis nemorensis]|uniref:Uncharacterized protein n=1 Tax=Arabis nemorensis TaxID=586526 RepID=A0A565CGF3_9BRAS|nr:unnamed protein product [Arabis nemorensis]
MTPPLSHRGAISSGDGLSPTPKKRTTTSSESLAQRVMIMRSNFHHLMVLRIRMAKVRDQRNLGCRKKDLGPRKRPVLTIKRYDTSVQEEANGPTDEVGFGTCSNHNGNGTRRNYLDRTNHSTLNKRSQSQTRSTKWNHKNPGCNNRDQSPKGRQKSPFDICSSVRRGNDRCTTDEFVEEDANGEETGKTVELSNKHRVLRPGMVLLKNYLTHDVQVDIVKTCQELGVKTQGFYQPGYKKLFQSFVCK